MAIIPQTVNRDTTLNTPGEIVRRIGMIGYVVSPFAALIFLFAVIWNRSPAYLAGTVGSAGLFVILHFCRGKWPRNNTPSSATCPASIDSPNPQLEITAKRTTPPRILLINASLAGDRGNTAILLRHVHKLLHNRAKIDAITLASTKGFEHIQPLISRADAVVFGTGTHWDSWSSHLQRLLEEATLSEGTALWLGKPAACIISEHSVGAKSVLSRLQGVLITMGCQIPPMSGVVISRAALAAGKQKDSGATDYWSLDDLNIVCENLLTALQGSGLWKAWSVDRTDFDKRWLHPES